jgi:diguanylate cyclase (GGDEF)-like protein
MSTNCPEAGPFLRPLQREWHNRELSAPTVAGSPHPGLLTTSNKSRYSTNSGGSTGDRRQGRQHLALTRSVRNRSTGIPNGPRFRRLDPRRRSLCLRTLAGKRQGGSKRASLAGPAPWCKLPPSLLDFRPAGPMSEKGTEMNAPVLKRLQSITAAVALGDPPRAILRRALQEIRRLADGTAVWLWVADEQLAIISPESAADDSDASIDEGVHLVCRGEMADQICDSEGGQEPMLRNGERLLIIPLTRGGIAVEDPRCGLLEDSTLILAIRLCADLASGVSRTALELDEARRRTVALEDTRVRLRQQNTMLRDLAVVDELTGLHNRRFFDRQLSDETERFHRHGKSLSLALLNVDHFGAVNDQHGHAVGDSVLQNLAKVVESSIRRVDLLARYGGEEFAILMPETDVAGSRIVGERVRKIVESTALRSGSTELQLTVSVGIASIDLGWSGDNEGILRLADRALYQAKHQGRNCVVSCYAPEKFEDDDTQPLPPDREAKR